MVIWNEVNDVVVVGSGIAGLSAAIQAKLNGASVIVLEKMKMTGGNTRISDGGVVAPNNFLQRERGIEDSPQLFYDDMMNAGLGLNHPDLVRVLVENANETIDWTIETLGVHYKDRLDKFGGHSAARSLTTINHTGADFIDAQIKWLRNNEVEIRTGCFLSRLHRQDSGAVRGVEIRSGYVHPDDGSGSVQQVYARRAVVLATGGFGSDIRFRKLQHPKLDESVGSTNHRGATAEGLLTALQVHAAPVQLSWIQLGPWGCADEKGYGRGASFASYSVYPAGIVVDPATGKRIVNEWADRRQRSEAIFNTGHPCLGIVDSKGAQLAADSLKSGLRRGSVASFKTISAIASKFGLPKDRLARTIAEYNDLVDTAGRDPFGKNLAKGAYPLCHPPFYTLRLWPKVHYTCGGVGINTRAQVIDIHGKPIPCLFAAGEVCGGVHGASRLGSCSLTECLVFGRIAGQEAAVQPLREPT